MTSTLDSKNITFTEEWEQVYEEYESVLPTSLVEWIVPTRASSIATRATSRPLSTRMWFHQPFLFPGLVHQPWTSIGLHLQLLFILSDRTISRERERERERYAPDKQIGDGETGTRDDLRRIYKMEWKFIWNKHRTTLPIIPPQVVRPQELYVHGWTWYKTRDFCQRGRNISLWPSRGIIHRNLLGSCFRVSYGKLCRRCENQT